MSANCSSGILEIKEIVFEILLCLPVISLIRFKSVCKSWRSLIESPYFASQHNQRGMENNHKLIILQPNEVSGLYCKLLSSSTTFPHSHGDANKYQVPENLDLPEYFKNNTWEIRFGKMITCNGIICIHHPNPSWEWAVSLWNPATKKFRILPYSQLKLPRKGISSHGFGVDIKTNDFKVVKINFPTRRSKSINKYNQIEVYSLSTNSWKSLDHLILPIDCVISDPKTPYKNGEIYCWMGRDFYKGKGMICILSFNFSTEVFETIPLPKHDWEYSRSFRCPTLAILRGKIAVIIGVKHADSSDENYVSSYQICVMDEYGAKDSWTTLYTVGPFPFFSQPVGFPKDEDLFLFVKGGQNREQLCLCNLVTQQINNLPEQDSSDNLQVVVYKESLLPVE